jgi:hypothetical protein
MNTASKQDTVGAPAQAPAQMPSFDAIELNTCVEYTGYDGEINVTAITGKAELDSMIEEYGGYRMFYSVYLHLVAGGVQCVADCDAAEHAQFVGASLAKAHDVPLNDFLYVTEQEAA